ncbi:MAG: hypothetical protein Q3980_13960 [Turicibacter sp.]|nr:hypothetical protein [Turicibacter sp.]
MILPKKHVKLSESLFAIGAILLTTLKDNPSVDKIWNTISNDKNLNITISFDNFILALDYLYTIGAIDINEKGGVYRCT